MRVPLFFLVGGVIWSAIDASGSSLSGTTHPSSCEENGPPDHKGDRDKQHQCPHPRGCSSVAFSTSGLPVPPSDVRFRIRNQGHLSRHRSTSWMLSDMLWGGGFQYRIMISGGTTAHSTRTVLLEDAVTCPARPAAHTARTQTAAIMAFMYLSRIGGSVRPVTRCRCSGVHTRAAGPSGHGLAVAAPRGSERWAGMGR